MQARQVLEDLIAQGQLEQAIETYLSLSRQYGDEVRTNQGLHESGRYHALKEKNITGTISQADYQLEWNLINRSVLTQASKVPNTWKFPFEPLATPPLSVPSTTTNTPPPAQKSFLERWGLILGLVASLTTILGITLKDLIFPPKPEPQPAEINSQPIPSTTNSVPVPTTTQEVKKEPETNPTSQPKRNETPKPVATQPKTAPTTTKPSPTTTDQHSTSPVTTNTPPNTTSAPPVNNNTKPRFRSFSKLVIVEDMERGHDGNNRIMYRNVRTNEVLCCYDDGENFSGGKARVSQNGQYFYIDKKGNRVQ
jgi:Effector-associated domain 11